VRLSAAERKLVLISACVGVRRLQLSARAAALAEQADWTRIVEDLRRRRLLATLGPRLLELAQGEAPSELDDAVADALAAGRRQSAFIRLVGASVLDALEAAGVHAMSLKGPTLGELIYGDAGRRLSHDIDVLVAAEQMSDAVAAVRRLGYAEPTDYVADDGLPLLHFGLMHGDGLLPPVELHWRVHWYERRFARERLLPPRGAASEWRPQPADELISLLLFYARDGFVDLRLAADIAAWWDVFGARLTPGSLEQRMRDYPELRRALRGALGVAERVVGLPAAMLLGPSARSPRLRERTAMRLANPHPDSSASQLYADMGLIDGLLAPSGGHSAFIKRQLLLPREVLQERVSATPNRRLRKRIGHRGRVLIRCAVLGRYGVSLTRLARPREIAGRA
jgi:hypothetical protein